MKTTEKLNEFCASDTGPWPRPLQLPVQQCSGTNVILDSMKEFWLPEGTFISFLQGMPLPAWWVSLDQCQWSYWQKSTLTWDGGSGPGKWLGFGRPHCYWSRSLCRPSMPFPPAPFLLCSTYPQPVLPSFCPLALWRPLEGKTPLATCHDTHTLHLGFSDLYAPEYQFPEATARQKYCFSICALLIGSWWATVGIRVLVEMSLWPDPTGLFSHGCWRGIGRKVDVAL